MSYEALIDYFGTKKEYGCHWEGYTGPDNEILVLRVGTGFNYIRRAPNEAYFRPLLYTYVYGPKAKAIEEFFVQPVPHTLVKKKQSPFKTFVDDGQYMYCERLSNFDVFKWKQENNENL